MADTNDHDIPELPEDPDDLDIFLNKLQELGGSAGNKALRHALNWGGEEDRYWTAHGRALDAGKALRGQGKGGSIRLTSVDPGSDQAEPPRAGANDTTNADYSKESDLYAPALEAIKTGWVRIENYDDHVIEITAAKGSAATGGKWSRPDVSVLATKAFPYLPNRIFDIITFEIKPAGQITVEGVFEALSHQQFATQSYVVFHVPDQKVAENFIEKQDHADRILAIARNHGVGVIVAQDIKNWETWLELSPSERGQPDPNQANRFITTCFSKQNLERVIKWHK